MESLEIKRTQIWEKITRKVRSYNVEIETFQPLFLPRPHAINNWATHFRYMPIAITGTRLDPEHLWRILFYPGQPQIACVDLTYPNIYHLIYKGGWRITWRLQCQNADELQKETLTNEVDFDAYVWSVFDALSRFYDLTDLRTNYLAQLRNELLVKLMPSIPLGDHSPISQIFSMASIYAASTHESRQDDSFCVTTETVEALIQTIRQRAH